MNNDENIYPPGSSTNTNGGMNDLFYNFNYLDTRTNLNNPTILPDLSQNNLFFDLNNGLSNMTFSLGQINEPTLQSYAPISFTPYNATFASVNAEPVLDNSAYSNDMLQFTNRITPPLFQEMTNYIAEPQPQSSNSFYNTNTSNQRSNITSNLSAFENVTNYMYSASGFDLMTILAKVVNRKFPQIHLGPVDMSCAFLVVDALSFDFPIIYASQSFTDLTGYPTTEIVGRNCRFLQSPTGQVTLGSCRKYTDNNSVYQVKSQLSSAKETQVSLVNYKKGGRPFINLMTLIPVALNDRDISYYVGFQVDMVEQPNAIMNKMKDGTYSVNYSRMILPTQTLSLERNNFAGTDSDSDTLYQAIMGKEKDDSATDSDWQLQLLESSPDFKFVLTLKGIFLYASPNSQIMFGHDCYNLLTENISTICHPDDVVPIMRELKEASTIDEDTNSAPNFNLTFRIKKSDGVYVWIEALGCMSIDSAKGRRCMVLNGRLRNSYHLSNHTLSLASLKSGFDCLDDNDSFWLKLSNEGLILYSTSNCRKVVGFSPSELVGTSFYTLVRADRTAALSKALANVQERTVVRLRHRMGLKPRFTPRLQGNGFAYNTNNGMEPTMANVFSFFYPGGGDLTNEVEQPVPYVICQVRLLRKDPSHLNLSLENLTNLNVTESNLEDGLVTLSSSGNIYEHSPKFQPTTTSPTKSDQDGEGLANLTYDNLLPYLDANFVEEEALATKRRPTSTWQYELHRLQTQNTQLRQAVDLLESTLVTTQNQDPNNCSPNSSLKSDSNYTNSRKRKTRIHPVNFTNLINQALHLQTDRNSLSNVTICTQCHKTETPEWRRGPLGPKTLCNSCGIKYAKKVSKNK